MDITTYLCLCLLPVVAFVQSQNETISEGLAGNLTTAPGASDMVTAIEFVYDTTTELPHNPPNDAVDGMTMKAVGTTAAIYVPKLVPTPPPDNSTIDITGTMMATENIKVTTLAVNLTTPAQKMSTTEGDIVTEEIMVTTLPKKLTTLIQNMLTTEGEIVVMTTATEKILVTTLPEKLTTQKISTTKGKTASNAPAVTDIKTAEIQPSTQQTSGGTCADAPKDFCPGNFHVCVNNLAGGYTCQDITCENAPSGTVCSGKGEKCENISGGGYKCKCEDNYVRTEDDTHCEERVVPGGKVVPKAHHYTGAIVGILVALVIACLLFMTAYLYRRKLRNNYGRLGEEREGEHGWSAFSKNPIYRGDKDYQLL